MEIKKDQEKFVANDKIKFKIVKLLDENGTFVGEKDINDAINLAYDQMLDLVLINKNDNPPLCKIADLGKLKFEDSKKAKNKEKSSKLNIIKFRPNIDENDLNIKIKKIKELISKKHKCKIVISFKKGEMRHVDIGNNLLSKIISSTMEFAKIESKFNNLEVRDIGCIITPK